MNENPFIVIENHAGNSKIINNQIFFYINIEQTIVHKSDFYKQSVFTTANYIFRKKNFYFHQNIIFSPAFTQIEHINLLYLYNRQNIFFANNFINQIIDQNQKENEGNMSLLY